MIEKEKLRSISSLNALREARVENSKELCKLRNSFKFSVLSVRALFTLKNIGEMIIRGIFNK